MHQRFFSLRSPNDFPKRSYCSHSGTNGHARRSGLGSQPPARFRSSPLAFAPLVLSQTRMTPARILPLSSGAADCRQTLSVSHLVRWTILRQSVPEIVQSALVGRAIVSVPANNFFFVTTYLVTPLPFRPVPTVCAACPPHLYSHSGRKISANPRLRVTAFARLSYSLLRGAGHSHFVSDGLPVDGTARFFPQRRV